MKYYLTLLIGILLGTTLSYKGGKTYKLTKILIQRDTIVVMPCVVTCYEAKKSQCYGNPKITASGYEISSCKNAGRDSIIALSRDLERGLGLKFGDSVIVIVGNDTLGAYRFEDRANKRLKGVADIMVSYGCKEFKGFEKGKLIVKK
jgi:hypothetical protein